MNKRIAFVFVMALGLTTLLAAQDSSQDSSQPANVAGKWQLSSQGRQGARQSTLDLQQDGDKLTGTLEGERGTANITGSINGNNVTFSTEASGERHVSLLYTGTVNGDKMSGTMQFQGGPPGMRGGQRGGSGRSWSAARQAANGPGAANGSGSNGSLPGN